MTNYAKIFNGAHGIMNVLFVNESGPGQGHVAKMLDALETIGLSHKLILANALDTLDFEIPVIDAGTEKVVRSNIFDGVDVVILADYSKARPIVKSLIVEQILNRPPSLSQSPMFVITVNPDDDNTPLYRLNFVTIEI